MIDAAVVALSVPATVRLVLSSRLKLAAVTLPRVETALAALFSVQAPPLPTKAGTVSGPPD